MTRIPSHTLTEAPAASRPLLEGAARSSPTGKPLNLHAQMAHSPSVLAAYTSIREAIAAHGTLDPRSVRRSCSPRLASATAAMPRTLPRA